jgi:hypothetical protein
MADVNFNLANPYQTQLDELARRQKMAEIMQQQSFQPMERFSYQGIEAPISPLAGLTKALQGYMGGKAQRDIADERKAVGEKFQKEGMEDIMKYAEMASRPAVAAVQGQEAFTPMASDYQDRGNAPDFTLNEQGMVPAVAPVAARTRGQIDASMIGQLKTPDMQRMALAQMLKQGELPAAFNLGADETRFQPQVGGGAPIVMARGAPKPLPSPFAPINPKDFTPASLAAALKPDGSIDRTLLVAVTAEPTGNLAELSVENANRKDKGLPPLSIAQYRELIAKAGRTQAPQRERFVYDPERGGRVNLDTGEFLPITQSGMPIGAKDKPLTEVQGKSTGFATRADEADKIIGSVGESGKIQPSLLKSAAGAVPVIGGGLETITNFAASSAQQQVEQAQRNFVNAILRQESGAAIGKDEFSNAQKQYFPQVGDSPEVIKQKSANRQTAINALKVQAGSGIKRMPQETKTTTIAEITDVANRTGKTVQQVTQDAVAKGYKVNQ